MDIVIKDLKSYFKDNSFKDDFQTAGPHIINGLSPLELPFDYSRKITSIPEFEGEATDEIEKMIKQQLESL